MHHGLQEQLAFHLTGRRTGAALGEAASRALRPALLAEFHDLTRLRYDFPVVLVEHAPADGAFRSLTDLVNDVLARLAPPGAAAERMRKSVLRLEREIRRLLAQGRSGRLSELWQAAAETAVARGDAAVLAELERARAALGVDGTLIDCGSSTAAAFATHAWGCVEDARARKMRREIEALIVRLAGLVKADHLRSEAGRQAATLRAGVGTAHRGLFDFDAMAQLLAKPSGASALSDSRRRRIDAVLAVLRAQRFFVAEEGYGYLYEDVDGALRAFRERLPAMAELVRAMAVAELEVDGRYVEAQHDEVFRGFGPASLGADDMAMFPSYLVCPTAGSAARTALIDALSSGAPIKILLETRDLLDTSPGGGEHASLGSVFATSVMGLGEAFVLQTTSSNLYRSRQRLRAALEFTGPALLSVYVGGAESGLPPYLASAAAMQSRAFPAYSYDPSAGIEWAQRFSLEGNPQPERAWPVHEFAYADAALQRVREELPFTLADFAVCDPRYVRHFARVPREQWNGSLQTVGEWLAGGGSGSGQRVPCVYAVDAEQRLQKLVVDDSLVQAAQRCAAAWRRLQELDGLKRPSPAAAPGTPAAPAEAAPAPAAPPAAPSATAASSAAPAPSERDPDLPHIETERCTTCNECTQINAVMFAYNENKQAYIANPDAGTYRQLVEAAESCQVSIIHPGKPRNPKEPGLDELKTRAEPFL